MAAGTCQFCSCTEAKACAGGCAWANDAQTICTVCAEAAETAKELVNILGITLMSGSAMRMATARFEMLPLEQQAVLVMTCRTMVDSIREGLGLALQEEAIDALRQIDRIGEFLLERMPGDVGEDESAADVVLRLFEPHVGGRIVLPGGSVRP